MRNIATANHILALGQDGAIDEQGTYAELSCPGGYLQRFACSSRPLEAIAPHEHPAKGETDVLGALTDLARRPEDKSTGDLSLYKYYIDQIGWTAFTALVVLCTGFVFAVVFQRKTRSVDILSGHIS